MCNLNYVPTTLGVQNRRELYVGVRGQKRLNTTVLNIFIKTKLMGARLLQVTWGTIRDKAGKQPYPQLDSNSQFYHAKAACAIRRCKTFLCPCKPTNRCRVVFAADILIIFVLC
jgi:hypothetical protein